MKKRVGIIGAGRFGMSLAESLMNAGSEVVLLDRNRPAMQSASEFATAIQGDATQPHVLQEAGFDECDVVVVAIGSNIEASMMATANCKELGVKTVISKASSELHGKILRRIGADSVIYPDRDSAHRLARAISNHDIVDFLEVSEGYSIAEIDVPEDMRGQTLAEANFRKETGLIVLCIRRASEDPKKPRSVIIPQASEQMLADDRLIVFGETKKLDELS
ncbi:MAG: TrkA family potassium uptake protein [Kiritimatiellae bacterium]|jgi:trk system potassium uptake protein TrkA|nr:TrkA family potassium uptake protein [Kiritimatiellia bacterium]